MSEQYQRYVVQIKTFDDDARYEPQGGIERMPATVLATSHAAALQLAATRFDVPLSQVEAMAL